MKKILLMMIVGILFLSGFRAIAFSDYNNDELDQYQTTCVALHVIGSFPPYDVQAAQSFIPQKEILTRIQLFICIDVEYLPRNPYVLAVRESLTGENLAEASVNPQNIPFDMAWIEFDFDDIEVNAGQTYYMVSYMPYDENQGFYLWGHSESNLYPHGNLYSTEDGGGIWTPLDIYDACFKTYGTYKPLGANANGPYQGGAGKNTQFEGSATGGVPPYNWYWDFGDGNTSTEQNPKHIYNEIGEYPVSLTVTDDIQNTDIAHTTATITESTDLDVEIKGGLGITMTISNIGEVDAPDVAWSVQGEGGLLSLINISDEGTTPSLEPEGTIIKSYMPIGLGPLHIIATVEADNTEQITKEADGFIVLFFVLIR